MSKAEDLSKQYKNFREQCDIKDPIMLNEIEESYFEGYQQAEKDFSLTSDDINDIIRIYEDVLETKSGENIYIEVLNRFNKQKEDGKVQNRT